METGFTSRGIITMRRFVSTGLILSLLLALAPRTVLAAGGRILTLNAWGGWASGTPVDVQATIFADSKINNSNLYYTISLAGTIYATHTTPMTPMNQYETRNDQWETTNTGWPEGEYTISICWSTGNSTNCNIDGPKTVVTHFVPTLGWGLTIVTVGILAYGLYRRREQFEPVPQRTPA
jgi:hypothetical protein